MIQSWLLGQKLHRETLGNALLTDLQQGPAVIKALEGFEFDGMGNGKTLYRAADHQCFKSCVVVRGKQNPKDKFDLMEVVKVVPREELMYDPTIFGGDLRRLIPRVLSP